MLSIQGKSNRYCDRIKRRSFLQIGALGLGGLTIADLFRIEAQAGVTSSNKALINIHLGGGPSHQDMWDLKPEAPAEYRGEFMPCKTNVPGMQICELMPNLAKRADRFALIRGMVGSVKSHSYHTAMTGYERDSLEAVGGRPSIGSVVNRVSKNPDRKAPPYVSLMGSVTPGFLGPVFQPYVPDGRGRRNLELRNIDAARLKSRSELLGKLDGLRREMDSSGKMEALDAFTQRAIDTVISGRMADALDVDKEDPKIAKRYGFERKDNRRYRDNRNLLVARRLVEAGVRCVAMKWGGWDTHKNNFVTLRDQLPALDAGLSALLDDLYERGLDKDVTVAVWGEFGRTPRVNSNAGRDHWPRLAAAWVAGGGMKTGQVIGESDRNAGDAVTPVHVHNVHATLYHNLGINPVTTQLMDPAGRPQYLLDHREPIHELI